MQTRRFSAILLKALRRLFLRKFVLHLPVQYALVINEHTGMFFFLKYGPLPTAPHRSLSRKTTFKQQSHSGVFHVGTALYIPVETAEVAVTVSMARSHIWLGDKRPLWSAVCLLTEGGLGSEGYWRWGVGSGAFLWNVNSETVPGGIDPLLPVQNCLLSLTLMEHGPSSVRCAWGLLRLAWLMPGFGVCGTTGVVCPQLK